MKLIILSDLLGHRNSNWVNTYTDLLRHKFQIQFYDCCELAQIDTQLIDKENIHQQFVTGGIEKAVEQLLHNEKNEITCIIGFSIGGLIAWKAALAGLKTSFICAISSTRLRCEIQKPNVFIHLFYGENDPYKPDEKWFELMQLDTVIFNNENHEFYMKQEFANKISLNIMEKMKSDFL
ncbi:hypothetical protein [Pedobacter sp. UBA4863]|uniref:hypothetical protein n=1 Tax=Pedobacter sp. UBA4863 TaxID=1947060 RepID=UPI0025EC130A|nr:hypothetical protein [Pedobacter sp. UBA4863]